MANALVHLECRTGNTPCALTAIQLGDLHGASVEWLQSTTPQQGAFLRQELAFSIKVSLLSLLKGNPLRRPAKSFILRQLDFGVETRRKVPLCFVQPPWSSVSRLLLGIKPFQSRYQCLAHSVPDQNLTSRDPTVQSLRRGLG